MYCIIIKSQDCVCNLGKLLHVYLCVCILLGPLAVAEIYYH